MRAAICDDDQHDLIVMDEALKEYCQMTGIMFTWDLFQTGEQLLVSQMSYDFVILDIQLEAAFGFDIAQQLHEKNPQTKIMYYSSNIEYSPDSFEAHAFAFLLKPLRKEKLFHRLDRILKAYMQDIIEIQDSNKIRHRIAVHDLQYIEAQRRKTIIITMKQRIIVNKSLTYWEESLYAYHFALCQRSILVNLNAVEELCVNQDIVLRNHEVFHLTREVGKKFKDELLTYWGDLYV